MKKIVEIKNLTKSFCKGNICVANKINIDIFEGEIFTILGTSGSGKTTFLRMLAGLENPDSAEIKIDGKIVFNSNINIEPKYREIAIVFQNYALLPHLNISSNIVFGSNATEDELEDILVKTKLKGHEDRFPHELSGGQQQRVALARAIINRPKILLLDEPLSNIDTELRTVLRTELKEMIKSFGITAIFITHDKEDAFFLSNKIAIINDGDILQVGTPKELYNNPKDLYCANFLGKINQLENNSFIRPENIIISSSGRYSSTIKDIIFYGSFFELIVSYNNSDILIYTVNSDFVVGDTISFDFEEKFLINIE